MQTVTEGERLLFLFLAPIAPFFPGLLANESLLSGNIAYILYAAIFSASWQGLRKAQWHWFYLATLLAAIVKPPMLFALLVPALSTRRQILPAAIAAATGASMLAAQALFFPSLFARFLITLHLQIQSHRDFGCSPAGLLSNLLARFVPDFCLLSLVFYAGYASVLLAILILLSRKFQRGDLSLQEWIPVVWIGTALLNPRLIEYDAAPLTLPMALIFYRCTRSLHRSLKRLFATTSVFVLVNVFAAGSWTHWKLAEGLVLVLSFAAGALRLARLPSVPAPQQVEIDQTELLYA